VKAVVAAPAAGGAVGAKVVQESGSETVAARAEQVAVQSTPPAAPEPAAVKASAPADAMATAELHMDDADQAQPPPAASGSVEDEVFEVCSAIDPGGDTAPAEAPADEVR
jgi:hypothetical protein